MSSRIKNSRKSKKSKTLKKPNKPNNKIIAILETVKSYYTKAKIIFYSIFSYKINFVNQNILIEIKRNAKYFRGSDAGKDGEMQLREKP
jgi:hypothetical protein